MNGRSRIQDQTSFDVIIVGAGISGINAAYRIQEQLPGLNYAIIEAREDLGGTWDLFCYPGIRSDSDLFTFGFAFNPWPHTNPIAEGAEIKSYIRRTANKFGIDLHILFQHRLLSADWSSADNTWSLTVDQKGQSKTKTYYARFVIFGTGYYNYKEPLQANIPGLDRFQGQTIHPQFWPEDLDYKDKQVIIVGSGATAVTMLPKWPRSAWIAWFLPAKLYHRFQRAMWIYTSRWFFLFCRNFPSVARWVFKRSVQQELPSHIDWDPHFKPRYNPWDQRLCITPEGDFYACLRDGKADIRTDTIKMVTEKGILLSSGEMLPADIIVTATGLQIQLAGGASISIDGQKVETGSKYLWRGIMMQDLPNAAFVIGYTNASWTLGADATAQFVTRMLKNMESRNFVAAIPRLEPKTIQRMHTRPVLNLSSTYIHAAKQTLPMAGDWGPWQPRDHYNKDIRFATKGNMDDGMEYVQGSDFPLYSQMS